MQALIFLKKVEQNNKHNAQIMDFLPINIHFVSYLANFGLKVYIKLEIILIFYYNNLDLQIV